MCASVQCSDTFRFAPSATANVCADIVLMAASRSPAAICKAIVSGKEIVLIIPREHRTRAHVVLVPADVDALRKIVAGIELMRNWPIGKLALGVEHPKLPARRIDDLVG